MLLKAAHQWVRSPLGLNILLSALKQNSPTVDKYSQVAELVKKNKRCFIETKLFVSSSSSSKKSRNVPKNQNTETTDFSKADNAFNMWVHQNGDFDVKRDVTSRTEFVLANITSFQGTWAKCQDSGPIMTVYNSFNYTQDVKYEARLLELPLESDFKLVVLVPNEVDVLQCLFKTLRSQGLKETINSIQPLFTVDCELNAPNIDVTSRMQLEEKVFQNTTTMQYGRLQVDKSKTSVTVLTCCHSPPSDTEPARNHEDIERVVYLALVYCDTPLFIGQFVK